MCTAAAGEESTSIRFMSTDNFGKLELGPNDNDVDE